MLANYKFIINALSADGARLFRTAKLVQVIFKNAVRTSRKTGLDHHKDQLVNAVPK
jgi:hypothetical protein